MATASVAMSTVTGRLTAKRGSMVRPPAPDVRCDRERSSSGLSRRCGRLFCLVDDPRPWRRRTGPRRRRPRPGPPGRSLLPIHGVAISTRSPLSKPSDLDLLHARRLGQTEEVPAPSLGHQRRARHDQRVVVGVGDDVDPDEGAGPQSGVALHGQRHLDRARGGIDRGRDALDEGFASALGGVGGEAHLLAG